MSQDDDREGPEFSRRIREELERIRESEAGVEEALGAVRQARRRVEVIARELGIAEVTVRNHIRAILLTLGCHSQLEAVAEEMRRDPKVFYMSTDPIGPLLEEFGDKRVRATPITEAAFTGMAIRAPGRGCGTSR